MTALKGGGLITKEGDTAFFPFEIHERSSDEDPVEDVGKDSAQGGRIVYEKLKKDGNVVSNLHVRGYQKGRKGQLTPAEDGVEDLPTTISRSRTRLHKKISTHTQSEKVFGLLEWKH